MLDVLQKAKEYQRSLPHNQFHIIQYDDIVYSPKETLESAFDFLNLSSDHDLLSQENWVGPDGELWETNSAFDGEFDKEEAVYRWKGNLKPEELSLCETIVGDIMTQFGYELSGAAPPDEQALDILREDNELSSYFNRWQETGKGVESYPSDPTNPDNWSENVTNS
jgi:hypothetical protein